MGGSSGDIVLAPQIGAGSKDTNNAFTGILMGSVKPAGSNDKQDGLFGYAAGKRSIFLDANTGNATFGTAGNGQILMTPSSGTITGGNYSTSAKTGMQINLKLPLITFGSGNFSVNSAGNLTAKGGGSIAGWSIGTDKLSKDTVGLSSNNNSTTNKAFWAGHATPASAPFNVDFTGKVKMTNAIIGNTTDGNGDVVVKNGKIYTENLLGSNNKKQTHDAYGDTTEGFYIGSNGISLGSNFRVNNQGSLIAKIGYIGDGSSGFKINSKSITNGKTSATDGNNGIYLGTDAIALGKDSKFIVTNSGALTSKSGNIGGWTIGSDGLYGNGATGSYYGSDKKTPLTTGVFLGKAGIRLGANFHVDSSGNMYANNGTFVGKITANSGTIAGWNIGANALTSKNEIMTINSNGSMKGPKWSIDNNGKATFSDINVTGGNWKSGTISGGSRTGGSIKGGSISPSKVGVSGYNNMQDWCNSSADNRIKAIYADLIDANYIQGKIATLSALKANSIKITGNNYHTGSDPDYAASRGYVNYRLSQDISNVKQQIPSLSGYATQSWVSANFARKTT